MLDVQSIIIYLGLPLLSFIIAKYAERRNSKKAVWLIVILFSLIAGLRAISVGIDTKTYDMVFSLVSRGNVEQMYGIEESFIYICAGLLHIWDNNQFLLFIFAFVTHGLILFRIWKDREFISFRWSVFSYYILFFAFSLNGMRQFVAVAIIFYATSFIRKGKYINFIISTLIASLFHASALIGLVYLLFEIIFTKYFDAKRKMTVYLFVVIGGILGVSVMFSLLDIYSSYFEQQSSSIGFMMIVKLVMLLLSFVCIKITQNKEERYFCLSNRLYYFIGLLLNSLNYIFLYMGRIGLYFYVFEAIYIGNLFKNKNRTIWAVLFKLGYLILLLYYLYDNITSGAQGELPYKFFWQS